MILETKDIAEEWLFIWWLEPTKTWFWNTGQASLTVLNFNRLNSSIKIFTSYFSVRNNKIHWQVQTQKTAVQWEGW